MTAPAAQTPQPTHHCGALVLGRTAAPAALWIGLDEAVFGHRADARALVSVSALMALPHLDKRLDEGRARRPTAAPLIAGDAVRHWVRLPDGPWSDAVGAALRTKAPDVWGCTVASDPGRSWLAVVLDSIEHDVRSFQALRSEPGSTDPDVRARLRAVIGRVGRTVCLAAVVGLDHGATVTPEVARRARALPGWVHHQIHTTQRRDSRPEDRMLDRVCTWGPAAQALWDKHAAFRSSAPAAAVPPAPSRPSP